MVPVALVTIQGLETSIKLLTSKLSSAKEVFFWRSEAFTGIEQLVVDMFENTLPQDYSGIHQELSNSKTRQKRGDLLKRVITAESDCLTLEVRWEFLDQLRLKKLVHIDGNGYYQMVRRVRRNLAEIVSQPYLLPAKVTFLSAEMQGENPPIQKQIVDHGLCTKGLVVQAKELVELFQGAVAVLRVESQNFLDPPEGADVGPYTSTKAKLQDELLALDVVAKAACAEILQQAQSPFITKTYCDQQDQTVDALLAGYRECDAEFSNWKRFSWFSTTYWYSYVPFVDKGDVANRMRQLSETVGCQITGLLRDLLQLHKSLPNVEIAPDCTVYDRAIQKVQKSVDDARSAMYPLIADRDFDNLHSYINGCDMALEEVRRLVALCKDGSTPYALAVYKTVRLTQNFLAVPKISFDLASALFTLAKARAAYNALPILPADGWTNLSLARMAKTIDGVFERYFNRNVELVGEEKTVWDRMMRKEEIAAAAEPFPVALQANVVKRSMKALYANSNNAINAELELLLWAARSSGAFRITKDASPIFKEVVEEYDFNYSTYRRDFLLEAAHRCLERVFKLHDEKADVVSYLDVVQICVEYVKTPLGEPLAEKELQKHRTALAELLFAKLNAFAKVHNFPLICKELFFAPVGYWNNAVGTVTCKDQNALNSIGMNNSILYMDVDPSDRKILVFESLVLRCAAASLKAKEPEERAKAKQYTSELFTIREFAEFLPKLSLHTKQLLLRYIMSKYHQEEDLLAEEAQYLQAHRTDDTLLARLTRLEGMIRQNQSPSPQRRQDFACWKAFRIEAGHNRHDSTDLDRRARYLKAFGALEDASE